MTPARATRADLSREEFARVRDLYHKAFGLAPAERSAVLDEACAGDAAVRVAVEELLDTAITDRDPFDPDTGGIVRRIIEESDELPEMPERVGPHRVIGLLGRGGMAEVYLAEQDHPQRKVALKVTRGAAGAAGGRFAREAAALARLEHPHIARIYDAGAVRTPQGPISYIAMEYVNGLALTAFADRERLTIAQRLELVAKIADAVQHAHTKGVIHRDIKPSNILVVPDETRPSHAGDSHAGDRTAGGVGPQPKILDFGVARVLESNGPPAQATRPGALIGTVAYMSPEQLGGDNDAVDARSDVYAIGVVLYELLAGRLPHDLGGLPIAEAARRVRDDPPATLVSPLARIDRDVSTIVRRAMEKDRARRYPTAAALAEDLRRYLRSEPILARPATISYQLSKLARRHRGMTVGLAAALSVLVAGLATSTALYVRAQAARTQAQAEQHRSDALSQYLLDDVLKAAEPDRLGEDATVLQALLSATESLHERFRNEPATEARVRLSLAEVLRSVGRLSDSLAQLDAALPILEATDGPDAAATIDALIRRARVLQEFRRFGDAFAASAEAERRAERSLPEDDPLRLRVTLQMAGAHSTRSAYAKAAAMLDGALAVAERSPESNAGLILDLLSARLYAEQRRRTSDPEVAAGLVRRISTRAAELDADDPDRLRALQSLLAYAMWSGSASDASAAADQLAAIMDAGKTTRPGLAQTYLRMSKAFADSGAFDRAERFALRAYESYAKLSPGVSKANQIATARLTAIYAAWPGHAPQLRDWTLRDLACRMMLARATEVGLVAARLSAAADALVAGAGDSSRDRVLASLLADLWDRRDQLAPPGHARRSAFFVTFATLCESPDAPHAREALALAEASAADATNRDAAVAAIEAARAALGRKPAVAPTAAPTDR